MKGIRPHRKRKVVKLTRHQKTLDVFNRRPSSKKSKKRHAYNWGYAKIKSKAQKSITSQTTNMTYTSAQIQRIIGFKDIYPEQKVPLLESLLGDIPRESLIRVAQLLTNIYKGANIEGMQKFFSPNKIALKDDFNNRFEEFSKSFKGDYSFCTIQTSVELLRHTFAIPYMYKEPKEQNFEENILRAILVINDKLVDFTGRSETNDTFTKMAELMVVNSFSQKDINSFDLNKVFRELFSKSIDLFDYVSTDEYFKPIYRIFLEKMQIKNYREYIKTILGLFTIMKDQDAGTFVYDPSKDPDNLINTNVLDYISWPIQNDITYEENRDYKIFRDKPLIKIKDDTYGIVNKGFILERLFSSLYFDFKNIAKELNLRGFEDQYKQSFMEKSLLCKYLEIINRNCQYKAMSSKDCQANRKKGDDGEPDYYMKSETGNIVLFENKDILIDGQIKESRDFNRIIQEYRNKLLTKTYNDKGSIRKSKPEGIGQLVEQIKKIQNGKAFWDKDASSENLIYPVLVLGDSKLLPDGMAYLMQEWYEDRCKSEEILKEKVRPLIVLSISTLLLYAEEIENKGFEYYFEKYYESMKKAKKQAGDFFLNCSNLSVSFSEYMEKVHPKDFSHVYEIYKKRLFNDYIE